MKITFYTLICFLSLSFLACQSTTSPKTESTPSEISIEKVILNPSDKPHGYYLSILPTSKTIKGVLVLLPGFGQKSEAIFTDSKFHEFAYSHDLLTIGFAGYTRMTADSLIQNRLNAVLEDVLQKNNITPDKFILGGFSAGGTIALRYAELCKQFPDAFPIQPRAVFMADSPVDLFYSWNLQAENLKNKHSEISTNEATFVQRFYREYYGATPSENPERFITLSPFSIDTTYGKHEVFLEQVAVRAYHDIDVAWRLKNRNQTARFDNYIATSELINRLMLLGNEEAEFMQTFGTGYRKNGERHPHSWSIIDVEECGEWMLQLLDF